MRAQRPQLGGQRAEPRKGGCRVRGGRTEVVQGLHQAALLGGQVGDRLRQGIIVLNAFPSLAGCARSPSLGAGRAGHCRAGPRVGAARAIGCPAARPGGAVLAGQVAGSPAECHQVARPDPPPWAGEQSRQGAGRGRVMQHPQGRDHVGHLGDGEQPAQADHFDRDPARLDGGPQHRELGPLAAEHRHVRCPQARAAGRRPAIPVRGRLRRQVQQPFNLRRDPCRLVRRGFQQGADHAPPPGPSRWRHQPRHQRRLRPQSLLQRGGCVQDPFGVAEAGRQLPDLGRAGAAAPAGAVPSPAGRPLASHGKVGDETAQVAGAGAAPAVDRLAGIADGGDRMPAAEQRLQQHQLGVAGVLVLVEKHYLEPGALDRTDLGMAAGDPCRQGDLVTVVDHFAGSLGARVGGHHREQLFPGALAPDDPADLGRHPAGERPAGRLQPPADLLDVGRRTQVLGEFAGQIEHRRGDPLRGPVDRVHRPAVAGDHPGRDLPRHRRGDEAQRRLQRLAQRVIGDEPGGVGMVGGHDRLAVQRLLRGRGRAARAPVTRRRLWPGQLGRPGRFRPAHGHARPPQAGQPGPDPLPQLGGGLAGEGEAEHPLRRDHAVGDQPDQPGGHGLALARARAGDHGQWLQRGGDHVRLLAGRLGQAQQHG